MVKSNFRIKYTPTIEVILISDGSGWRLDELLCAAGPGDPPFEAQHATSCIAAVTAGSFRYRSTRGAALMAPGALLLGNAGQAFECSHENHCGDHCLSWHFAPEFLERVVAGVHGVRQLDFKAQRVASSRDERRVTAALRHIEA